MRLADRFAAYAGLDSSWERPAPGPRERRADVTWALALLAMAVVSLELMRSFADFTGARPVWVQYLVVASLTPALAVRRRFPLLVALYACAHMVAVSVLVPEAAYQVPMQIAYFLAYFTCLAWGRDRRASVLVTGVILLVMAAWLALAYSVGSGIDDLERQFADKPPTQSGLLPRVAAYMLYNGLINILYFAGAVVWGLSSWQAARNRAVVAQQNARLAAQADELRERAVVEERLRIARELHDVVAHHVSVMGVQAGAARRVLAKDPDAAAQALGAVEASSRQAVTEMRGLLGTLRGGESREDSREPAPTLTELPQLVDSYAEPGFTPTFSLVEDEPGAAAGVPGPVAVVLYRTAQEALTNVRRHSSARTASVTVRVAHDQAGAPFAEVEVLDDGRPLGGTSGTGLGLVGMRERIAAHDGRVEVGPRIAGGYRVRVRLPLPAGTVSPGAPARTAPPGGAPTGTAASDDVPGVTGVAGVTDAPGGPGAWRGPEAVARRDARLGSGS